MAGGRAQDAAAVSEQKEEGWVPKAGSRVFVPRLGGDAKVRASWHLNLLATQTGSTAVCNNDLLCGAWCCGAQHVDMV